MRKRVFLAALLAVMVLAVGCTNGGYVPTSLAGYVYVQTSGSSAVISPSPTPPAGYQPLE
jgi:ABC-type molybdate transport system substrate-binding protein